MDIAKAKRGRLRRTRATGRGRLQVARWLLIAQVRVTPWFSMALEIGNDFNCYLQHTTSQMATPPKLN